MPSACESRRRSTNFSVKSEQPTLLSPVGWQARRPPHQCHGVELVRLATVDNSRGDVRRQLGKTQEGIDVSRRHPLLAIAESTFPVFSGSNAALVKVLLDLRD